MRHLLDVLEALDFDDPKAWHVQLPCSVGVDLYVQFLSVFTQQVSKNTKKDTPTIKTNNVE